MKGESEDSAAHKCLLITRSYSVHGITDPACGIFFSGGSEMRWSDQFLTEFEYELEKVVLPQGAFTSHVANGRFDLNFTNQWLTSMTLSTTIWIRSGD